MKKKSGLRRKGSLRKRKWELPKNGEILLIYKRKAELEAKRLLPWGKPSRYNYCELLISHLLHNDSLLFLTIFLGIDLLIGDPLYHVHYEASRDIGCIFFYLNRFVIFPPVWAHWTIMKCGAPPSWGVFLQPFISIRGRSLEIHMSPLVWPLGNHCSGLKV